SGANGIQFGQTAATSGTIVLADTKTITIGAGGFTTGILRFRNFIQTGSTPQSLTLTGTSALYMNSGSIFNADFTAASPQVYLNGSEFNGVTTIAKTGATNNIGTGGNTFNGLTTISNSGSGYLLLANTIA